MGVLHWLSILLEIGVSLLGIKLILRRKVYGWGILTTFSVYTFYDIAKYTTLPISSDVLYLLFFIASVSIFWAVWQISKNKKG